MLNSDIVYRLSNLGFVIKKNLVLNKINRCGTKSKPKSKNGWYYVNDTYANYGSWDNSIENGYFLVTEKKTFTEAEKKIYFQKLEEQKLLLERIEKENRIERIKDVQNYSNSLPKNNRNNVINHGYLIKKGLVDKDFYYAHCLDFNLDFQKRLVIPIYDVDNQLVGCQYINENGDKKFKTGSILSNSFYPIIANELKLEDIQSFYFVEGIATGISLYQALDYVIGGTYAVIVCFNAGNIDKVYNMITKKYKSFYNIVVKDYDIAGIKSNCKGFIVGYCKGQDANDIHNRYSIECLADVISSNLK